MRCSLGYSSGMSPEAKAVPTGWRFSFKNTNGLICRAAWLPGLPQKLLLKHH